MKSQKTSLFSRVSLKLRPKLLVVLLLENILPIILLLILAFVSINMLSTALRDIAVEDSSQALNKSATENIERITTDIASDVSKFLYDRDDDVLFLASLGVPSSDEIYKSFITSKKGRVIEKGTWEEAADGKSWVQTDAETNTEEVESTNPNNNDEDSFHYRIPEKYTYKSIPLYDEITYVDLDGNELYKTVAEDSPKKNYPLSHNLRNVKLKENGNYYNTYVKAETYFDEIEALERGSVYVSDVIGAYAKTNYIGMYASKTIPEGTPYEPLEQAYAGRENPNGVRFEGIIRWATPVFDSLNVKRGYVTVALNHDHIMEMVDHITPMNERYTNLPSAFEGNYAFIWDYKCRSIAHPRHHSIVGYNAVTGDPEIPWLETSIYEGWQAAIEELRANTGNPNATISWEDYIVSAGIKEFYEQDRDKKPAPTLTKQGLVGLDGRYLNNAPQCTGWMDLTEKGGSGSFLIKWSGLYKLTTAAAIPYYTGHYAPEANNGSLRGFGIVTVGAGLDDFTRPADETSAKLEQASGDTLKNTVILLGITFTIIVVIIVIIALFLANAISSGITNLVKGVSSFSNGERQYRFYSEARDEFGTLADSFDDMADSIVASVTNPLCITDMDRKIKYMNDAGLRICHMTLDEIVGTSYRNSSVYPPDSIYCPITALNEGREAEVFHLMPEDKYVRGNANYLMDKEGKRIGYIIESIDMTEIVRQQMESEKQRTLFDKVITTSPDLLWYLDQKGIYLTANPRYTAVIGCSPDELIGKYSAEVLAKCGAKTLTDGDNEALESQQTVFKEEHLAFADGHSEILETVRIPIFDAAGMFIGILGYGRDVTVRVEMDGTLRKTQAELEQAVRSANLANGHKGDFLARMSHEIRTPMNAIIGIAGIINKKLREMTPSEEISDLKKSIGQVENSSQHLLGLLNDILDISKIEAGKIELSLEPTKLNDILETVCTIIRPRCAEKNQIFVADFDDFEPVVYNTDQLRLRQVLINLLGNSVKFTPERGNIVFTAKKIEERTHGTLVHFSVSDTGIGIAEEARATIFQPFEQENNSITTRFGGTGLGLSICKSIVNLFGGDIAVDSAIGEGSTFSFDIFITRSDVVIDDVVVEHDLEGKFKGKRILLVDDVEINRIVVCSMLGDTALVIDEADDGTTAIEKFKASPENTYDLIFMDIKMTKLDGYGAVEAIRAMNRNDAKKVPIIALTANAFKDDIEKAIKSGMNAHLAKPVEFERLVKVLYRYLQQ